MEALFLGVLRTVELEQAAPLMPFFPKLLAQQASLQGPPAEWTMEILLEYCALHCSGGAASHLLQFYPPLLQICQTQLQAASSASTRTTEMSLQLLQLLLAHAPNAEALQKTKEVVVPLCRWWATTFDPWATKSAFAYPITTFLGILGAWHACHPGDFTEQVSAFGHPKLSVLLAACCKQARSISLRSSVISAALTLAESGVEEQFWREVMNGCNELILAANQRGISSALAKTLQSLKASLSVKLPAPVGGLSRNCTVQEPRMTALQLRRRAEEDLRVHLKHLVTADGRVLCGLRRLTAQGVAPGDTLTATVRQAVGCDGGRPVADGRGESVKR
eukprot:g19071.t1